MIKRTVSRRDFLALSGATAAGAVLAACGPAAAPGAESDGAICLPPKAIRSSIPIRTRIQICSAATSD